MTESHVFDPKKIEILESEERKTWQNTQEIFDLINLKPNNVVTDLGCGSGYFSIPISLIVKKVYSIDFQKEMLDYLKQKIEKKKIHNIEPLLSKADRIPLINNCTDLLLSVNTLHEFENRNYVILEIHRLINENGKLVIIDFIKQETTFGPPIEIRISKDQAINLFETMDFKFINSFDLKYHYLIIFQKI